MNLANPARLPEPKGASPWARFKRLFRRTAAHPAQSFLVPFLFVLIGRLLLLVKFPPPQPCIHDEFCNLLAADTYASFRLTNPPHPLWQHFETIHELMQPTYMSKYAPVQGMIMAFGQLVFGMPWIGVLLSMAVFCGLLPWVFRGWMPATWALIGALLASCKIGIFSYWTNSFWGGGGAAIGGALALGAVAKLAYKPTPGMAVVFVLGMGILANSRPDGCPVILLICGGFLAWSWFGNGRYRETWPTYPLSILPVSCLVAVPILIFMGYYNYKVTGSALELPYQIFEKQYSTWTPFIWQHAPSPAPLYRHEFIRRFWIDWDGRQKVFEHQHWLHVHLAAFRMAVHVYFGRAFYPALILLGPLLLLGRKGRSIFVLLLIYCASFGLVTVIFPHYTAYGAALIYLTAAAALRASWYFAPGGLPWGKGAVLALVTAYLLFTFLSPAGLNDELGNLEFLAKREGVLEVLEAQPGRQLVFVRHGPAASVHDIWIFNRADIDASQIVWADSMGVAENQQLLDYYAPQKRTAWMLDDDVETTLRPYADPEAKPLFERKNKLELPNPEQ